MFYLLPGLASTELAGDTASVTVHAADRVPVASWTVTTKYYTTELRLGVVTHASAALHEADLADTDAVVLVIDSQQVSHKRK
jgi:hypothetical protein